jgi:hypothetical protein
METTIMTLHVQEIVSQQLKELSTEIAKIDNKISAAPAIYAAGAGPFVDRNAQQRTCADDSTSIYMQTSQQEGEDYRADTGQGMYGEEYRADTDQGMYGEEYRADTDQGMYGEEYMADTDQGMYGEDHGHYELDQGTDDVEYGIREDDYGMNQDTDDVDYGGYDDSGQLTGPEEGANHGGHDKEVCHTCGRPW